jgi:hypothetical protein
LSYFDRVYVAVRLSRDLDTCEQLLRGEAVDESLLDPRGLAWSLQRRRVQLMAPVEAFADQLREAQP